MPPINFITSMVAFLGFVLVLRAFIPLLWGAISPFAYHLLRALILTAVVALLRTGYWDILQFTLGDDWPAVSGFLGGQRVSTVVNVLILLPVYDCLYARYLAIPEAERGRWHWLTAWAHPGGKCLSRWRR